MSTSRRTIGGVTIPDADLVARAMEEARAISEPYLFNHAVRSWLFAVQIAELLDSSPNESPKGPWRASSPHSNAPFSE